MFSRRIVTKARAGTRCCASWPTGRPALLNPNDFSAFKIITDRNIFDPNRRPRIAAQQAEQPIVDSFSLAGTMSYEKGLFAVFDGTSSDYHRVLEPGGSIAGYLVGEIRQDAVKLSSGTNELDLTVGMQMRRNEDGRWSVGGQPQQPGTSHASDSSPSPPQIEPMRRPILSLRLPLPVNPTASMGRSQWATRDPMQRMLRRRCPTEIPTIQSRE